MVKRLAMTSLLAAALALPSFAQQESAPDPGMRQGRGPVQQRNTLMKQLNLTDQQQTQMQKLRLDMQKKEVALQGKVRLLRIELKELFLADDPEKNAIEKKMKEISDLQHQEKVASLEHLFAVKTVLTPEQQKIWKKHMREVGPEFRQGMMQRQGNRREGMQRERIINRQEERIIEN
jgi:Spy/CpxP family protein refolding chaperone